MKLSHAPLPLVLGGARSGKSRLAEQIALDCGLPVTVRVQPTCPAVVLRAAG